MMNPPEVCNSCGSKDVGIDDKKSTCCKCCGQVIDHVWVCLVCEETTTTMTFTPQTQFTKKKHIGYMGEVAEIGRIKGSIFDKLTKEEQEFLGL